MKLTIEIKFTQIQDGSKVQALAMFKTDGGQEHRHVRIGDNADEAMSAVVAFGLDFINAEV